MAQLDPQRTVLEHRDDLANRFAENFAGFRRAAHDPGHIVVGRVLELAATCIELFPANEERIR